MLYRFVKWLVRSGLILFFRGIKFENRDRLYEEGPMLLACNHPNSFLDALIVGSHFKRPVHFLARGDAFKNPLAKKILTALKVIPIFRLSEGKEYLALNDATFEKCIRILMNGGIVLIFSEGLCINQWSLRVLKKGTARIALNAWKQEEIATAFRIVPVSLNYSSFTNFRKNVVVDFGAPIVNGDLHLENSEGEQITELNKVIYKRLEKGLIREETNIHTIQFLLSNFALLEKRKRRIIETLKTIQTSLKDDLEGNFEKFVGTKRTTLKISDQLICLVFILILFIPAIIGLLINAPLFFPINNYIKKKTSGTVFYHSALFGVLLISYPLYVLIISICVAVAVGNSNFLLLVFAMPFLAFLFLFWKDCIEGVINYYKADRSVRNTIRNLIEAS